jgi:hypothetical protein
MMEMLKGNLILDSVAAKAFSDRGYLEYTGATAAKMDVPFGAQYFSNPAYCGQYTGTYGPLKDTPLADVQKIVDVHPDAIIVSEITDHDRKTVCPGMTLFRNKLGGKVAVMNLRVSPTLDDVRQFVSYQMQTVMKNLLREMDPSVLPAVVEDPSCFAVQYFENRTHAFVGISNISYDVAQEITISFENAALDVENGCYLNEDGTLLPLSGIMEALGGNKWKIRKTLSIFHFFALQIPIRERY